MNNSKKYLSYCLQEIENIFNDFDKLSLRYYNLINECEKNGSYTFEKQLGPRNLIDVNNCNILTIVKENIKQKLKE